MQQLNSSYCQWFNRRHERVGHVLQGRFKCNLVEDDASLIRALRYIVRNPVAARYVQDAAAWRWSSYRATADLDTAPPWLDVAGVWAMFDDGSGPRASEQFRLLAASSLDDVSPMASLLAGSSDFARRLEPNFEAHTDDENFVYADRFATRPALSELLPPHLPGPELHATVRVAYLRYAYTLRELGRLLGRPTSRDWSWIQRAEAEK
jgi:putative transposase